MKKIKLLLVAVTLGLATLYSCDDTANKVKDATKNAKEEVKKEANKVEKAAKDTVAKVADTTATAVKKVGAKKENK